MSVSAISPDARRAATIAAATSTIMIAQTIAAKAVRDAFFLHHYDVTSLPVMVMAASLLSIAMVLVMGRLLRAFAPARLVPVVFGLSGGLYLLEWLASGTFPRAVAILVYVHAATFGASAVSGFWSVINERFDPYTAKRVIGTIAGGATTGGVVGGVAVWQLAPHVRLESILIVLCVMNVAAASLLSRLGRKAEENTGESEPAPRHAVEPVSAIKLLRSHPYLRSIGLFVALFAVCTAMLDYAFKARAAEHYTSGEELVGFFALFYTIVGLVTFVVQAGLVQRVLVRIGVTPTLAVLPVMVIVLGVGALAMPGLALVTLLRGSTATAENSFYRSAYELLYMPLAPAQKRATKLVVDVGVDRAGEAIGSGMVLALNAALWAGTTQRMPLELETVLLTLAAVASGVLLGLLVWVHRGYVGALAQSLRAGALRIDDGQDYAGDFKSTRKALSRTIADDSLKDLLQASRAPVSPQSRTTDDFGLRGERLRQLIAEHKERRSSGGRAPVVSRATPQPARVMREEADDVVAALRVLRSRDRDAIEALSHRGVALEPDLVAHMLPLLDDDELTPIIEPLLARMVPRVTGQLSDALLSPRFPAKSRGRIANLLSSTSTTRAVRRLMDGLDASSFEVAHQCAVALLRLCEESPIVVPPARSIYACINRELTRRSPLRRRYESPSGGERSPFEPLADKQVTLQLVHVFTLLGTILEREPLSLAFSSLKSQDAGARGTALEYLENVLPTDVRRSLWRHIDVAGPLTRRPSFDQGELAKWGRALHDEQLTLVELRARFRERASGD